MGESKGLQWAAPPLYIGRRPMELSFQESILREDLTRRKWMAAWSGTFKEHLQKAAVNHETSSHETYFTTKFPIVSSTVIGQTTFTLRKKRRVAKAKSWAERNIASSETRRSMDLDWVHEDGSAVEGRCAVAPPRCDSFKQLGNTRQLSLSEKTLHLGPDSKYPRGTRAAMFHEPLNPNTDFITTLDFRQALKSERKSPSRPTSSIRTRRDAAVPRASSVRVTKAPHVDLLKPVSRRDPRVGYVKSVWAATGQGLGAAIPELPKQPEKVTDFRQATAK